MATPKASKKAVQPAKKRKAATISDKALPAKKAAAVKGGAVRRTGDDL